MESMAVDVIRFSPYQMSGLGTDSMLRPYIVHPYRGIIIRLTEPDNAVGMVGHDHERVQFDLATDIFGRLPFLMRNLAILVQDDVVIDNLAE